MSCILPPQISPSKPNPDNVIEDDLLESFQDIPSAFDVALNGGTNRTFLSSNPAKSTDATLLNPEAFRRLSISTISSLGQPRGLSPYPIAVPTGTKIPKNAFRIFWLRNQGLILVSVSQLFGALMNITARLLENEGERMHPFQLLFARMSLTLVFCCCWMYWKRVPDFPLGSPDVRWLLVARGVAGFFGIFGLYYSLQYLPVADAVVLTFLAPSVASYGCYYFLKEPFPRSAQYASLISLLGVILIARPTSFFNSSSSPSVTDHPSTPNSTSATGGYESSFLKPTPAQRLSAVAVAMLGVLGGAGAFTTIRLIGSRAHALISVNYFAVSCIFVSLITFTLSNPLHLSSAFAFALPHGPRQWCMIILLGICGFIAQFLLTKGLGAGERGGRATTTSMNMIYTNMLFALALDKLVFGQSPGWWSLAGSGLILGSAVFVAVQQQQTTRGREIDEEGGVGGRVELEEEEMHMLGGVESGGVEIADEAEELRHLSR